MRKKLLGMSIAAALLAGCAGPGGPGVSADTVARYQAIANGLLSIAATEAQIAGASPTLVARIQADADLARTAIAGLAPGLQAAAAVPTVKSVQAAVEDALAVAENLSLPASVQQLVLALRVLLPVAEAAIVPAPTPAPAAGAMSPGQALRVLQSAPRG